jgi:hypothetical protein
MPPVVAGGADMLGIGVTTLDVLGAADVTGGTTDEAAGVTGGFIVDAAGGATLAEGVPTTGGLLDAAPPGVLTLGAADGCADPVEVADVATAPKVWSSSPEQATKPSPASPAAKISVGRET